MKLSIVNNTGQYKNDDIYFGIIGEQSGQWGFINPNGSWQKAPPISQKVNVPFFNLASQTSIALSPPIISGRCWLSIGQPLIVPIWDSGFVGPGFNTATDPNYNIIFDKFEFTYNSNKTIFCNTTSVDFFGLPITAKLIGNKIHRVGISVSRSQVFKTFQETPPFDSLIRTVDNTQLRILAPQKDSAFNPTYFDPYIAQSWKHYQRQSLTLQPLPYNSTTYISTGSVDTNNVFNFVTMPGNTKHTIGKPTSTDVFGCAGVFNPTGSGLAQIIDGDIKNQVSSALNRTILLNSDSSTWCDASKYYLNSITNYYAKILHELSINGKSYAFPYDDKCDHSSTIVDTSPKEIELTLTAFLGGEPPTKSIALRAHNGQYVCAEGGGGREVVANRDQIRGWETFELLELGDGKIALRAHNGQYLCAEGGGGREVVANRNQIRGWETFQKTVVQ